MIRRSRVSAGESTPDRTYRRACRSREDPDVPRYRSAASANDSNVVRGALRDPPTFRPPETSASPATTRSLHVTTPPSRHQASSGVGAGKPRSRVTSTLPALKRCPLTSGRRGARDGCGDPISTRPDGGSGVGNPQRCAAVRREKIWCSLRIGRSVRHRYSRVDVSLLREGSITTPRADRCRSFARIRLADTPAARSSPARRAIPSRWAGSAARRLMLPGSRPSASSAGGSTGSDRWGQSHPPVDARDAKDPGHFGRVRDCGTHPK